MSTEAQKRIDAIRRIEDLLRKAVGANKVEVPVEDLRILLSMSED